MRARRVAVVVLLALFLLASRLPADASHGDGAKLQAWVKAATFEYREDRCVYDISLWVQEFGKHGVEQFKIRFRRYLGAIAEYSPTADYLRSISGDTGWLYSSPFPNDTLNRYVDSRWIASVRMVQNNYTLRAKAVGIRPSWWQPDLKANVHFGYCEAQISLGS